MRGIASSIYTKNTGYWQRFTDCLRWCHERDIFIQFEVTRPTSDDLMVQFAATKSGLFVRVEDGVIANVVFRVPVCGFVRGHLWVTVEGATVTR